MLTVRLMRSSEVALAVRWAQAEGWNPGVNDAELFAVADPGAFFVAELGGTPVGTISAVCYDDAFAFIGCFIVAPEHRGKGIGTMLWRTATERAGARNLGLDGVIEQIPRYEGYGFRVDHRSVRYQALGTGRAPKRTTPIDAGLLDAVIEYDLACFPADRRSFVRQWVTQPQAFARCVLDGERIRGYGVLRRCGDGWKIGPLFADDDAIARQLYDDLRGHARTAEHVYLDVPRAHVRATALACGARMHPVFETARMYTNGRPAFAFERCFGLTSFELG